MKNLLLYGSILLLGVACSSGETDQETTKVTLSGTIEVSQLTARPVSQGQNSAAYFTIINGLKSADTLTTMESQFFEGAELHESYTTEEGLSGMRPVGNIVIPSGDSLVLKPGSYHVMLMRAKRNFAAGDTLPLILNFSQSGKKSLNLPINRF
ncbi:copper chaperone PCu(A)C [Balneolaceae bacterium YR4-1]|uniref:Copper chaperone PCu(A)C n=1 Tax=Halalkalibaculum roseum TaxID=2709311 RepID=A0A6M1SS26_9BACT|nr:copper chaperone PCu(A)C [Halalkalibaculum roseum]NGP75542.1 copper chaperone PCu(A)C [Halalkalibaculum roseum]